MLENARYIWQSPRFTIYVQKCVANLLAIRKAQFVKFVRFITVKSSFVIDDSIYVRLINVSPIAALLYCTFYVN